MQLDIAVWIYVQCLYIKNHSCYSIICGYCFQRLSFQSSQAIVLNFMQNILNFFRLNNKHQKPQTFSELNNQTRDNYKKEGGGMYFAGKSLTSKKSEFLLCKSKTMIFLRMRRSTAKRFCKFPCNQITRSPPILYRSSYISHMVKARLVAQWHQRQKSGAKPKPCSWTD